MTCMWECHAAVGSDMESHHMTLPYLEVQGLIVSRLQVEL